MDNVGKNDRQQSGSRHCRGRNENAAASIQVPRVGPEVVHQAVEVVENRQVHLREIAGERMPVDHLHVFIGHVERPHGVVFAAPFAEQGKRFPPGAGAGDEQIAAIGPHFLDQFDRCLALVRFEQKFFRRSGMTCSGASQVKGHAPEEFAVLDLMGRQKFVIIHRQRFKLTPQPFPRSAALLADEKLHRDDRLRGASHLPTTLRGGQLAAAQADTRHRPEILPVVVAGRVEQVVTFRLRLRVRRKKKRLVRGVACLAGAQETEADFSGPDPARHCDLHHHGIVCAGNKERPVTGGGAVVPTDFNLSVLHVQAPAVIFETADRRHLDLQAGQG